MEYSLNGTDWSESIPTGTAVQPYTVYYRVKGNENYANLQDNETMKVTASILKAAQSRPASGEGYSIDASTKAITITEGFEVINDEGTPVASGTEVMLNKTYSIRKAVNTNYTPSPYDDAFSVSTWAMAAMQWACGSGIINGIGSNLVPTGNATRAQVATMLMRYSTK